MIEAFDWTKFSLISLCVGNVILTRWIYQLFYRIEALEMWVINAEQQINREKRIIDYTNKGLRNELHK